MATKVTSNDILSVAKSFIGMNEADKTYMEILNIYNGHKPLARGYAIKPSDQWCDCFASAVAIKAKAVDLIGTEVGVEKHVDIFKKKGIWIEDGTIIPKPGFLIVFNWEGKEQPNDGYSDHIGYVEYVKDGIIHTIEGNRSNSVKRCTYKVGDVSIRGFASPKYCKEKPAEKKTDSEVAKEVVAGKWGNGSDRKKKLIDAGYDYDAIQVLVNEMLQPDDKFTDEDYKEVAKEVYRGDWGDGEYRKKKLTAAGYNYDKVQKIINDTYYK